MHLLWLSLSAMHFVWIYGEEKETATGLVKAEKRREQKQCEMFVFEASALGWYL